MVVTCSPTFCQVIWDCRQRLGGQTDPDYKWTFYVAIKKPEDIKAGNSRYKKKIEAVLEANEGKLAHEKEHPCVIGGKFTINGEVIPDLVYPPDVQTLMNLTPGVIEEFAKVPMEISNNYSLSKSTFRGYCVQIASY